MDGSVSRSQGQSRPSVAAESNHFLDAALRYAARNWPVLPLRPDGAVDRKTGKPASKWPLTENGLNDATTDADQIRKWWAETPNANIGIRTGQESGITVIDVDISVDKKTGQPKPGAQSLAELGLAEDNTLTVQTTSGGWHYYYQYAPGDKSRGDKILPGIDTRGKGGYVVAPGSVIDGVPYEVVADHPVAPMRPDVRERLFPKANGKDKPPPAAQPIPMTDDEYQQLRMKVAAINPDCGYDDWLKVGMGLHNEYGGSEQAFRIWDGWSYIGDKYAPGETRRKWKSFKIMPEAEGIRIGTVYALAKAAEPAPPTFAMESSKPITVSHAELAKRKFDPIKWGIHKILTGVGLLASKPKIGKSWFAMQMCWAKAAGRELWDGREPETKGGALYLALEDNLRRLQKRSDTSFPMHVVRDANGEITWQTDRLPNLHFATEWPRVGSGGLRQLRKWLDEHPDCELVVIDTWARIAPPTKGAKIYQEDYAVGEALKPIADQYGVAILVIHHTRKMEADDPLDLVSGTQGLAGSVDTVMVLNRLRGASEAGLFITGRDISEQTDMVLRFDDRSCTWSNVGVSVAEAKLEEGRRQIVEVVRRAEQPLTIRQIRAGLTEDGISKSGDAVAKTVGRMVKDGELEKVESNKYDLPQGMYQ